MPRFTYIDGLRGIAASVVMLHHFTAHRIFDGQSFGGLFDRGYLGVPIFFVISGFVIAHSVGHSKVGAKYLANFALRRSLRLDPPYWIAIAAAVLGGVAGRMIFHEQGTAAPTLGCLVAHVAYVYPLLGYEPIEASFWTLVHEVQFYLLYVIAIGVVQRLSSVERPSRWLMLLLFGATAVASATGFYRYPGLCLETWYMFALGVFAYWWFSGDLSFWQTALIAVGVACTVPTEFKVAALVTTATLWAAIYGGKLTTWLNWRAFQYLGSISYSLYLFHGIIGWRVLSVGDKLTGHRYALAWLVLAIAASVLTAHLMRVWVELPSIRLGKRLKLQ